MKWAHKINLTADAFRELANEVLEEVLENADAFETLTPREWQDKFASELCRTVNARREDLAGLSGCNTEEN